MIIPTTNNIPDLSGMKATHTKDGERYLIIKVDNSRDDKRDCFLAFNDRLRDGWLNQSDLSEYTPLPSTSPEYVTLTLDNGETVRCEWKPTHTHDLTRGTNDYSAIRERMLLRRSGHDDLISISSNGNVAMNIMARHYTPLPSPESAKDKAVRDMRTTLDELLRCHGTGYGDESKGLQRLDKALKIIESQSKAIRDHTMAIVECVKYIQGGDYGLPGGLDRFERKRLESIIKHAGSIIELLANEPEEGREDTEERQHPFIERMVTCPVCHGTGSDVRRDKLGNVLEGIDCCDTCKGIGQIVEQDFTGGDTA